MKLSYFVTVASVLAAATFATPVDADPGSPATLARSGAPCALGQGLPADPVDALALASACTRNAAVGVSVREDIAADLRLLTARHRERAGIEPMAERASLDQAALLHAMDMAVRGYTAHADPEGRGHDWRIALTEREALIGAVGASIIVLPAERADAMLAFRSLAGEVVNRANLDRDAFDMTGVGVVEADGKVFIVQVFADHAGSLSAPIAASGPVRTVEMTSLERSEGVQGWRLKASDGVILDRSGRAQLSVAEVPGLGLGRLEVIVTDGFTQRTLAGPLARY
jgi:uncharacterized protein YkwD